MRKANVFQKDFVYCVNNFDREGSLIPVKIKN